MNHEGYEKRLEVLRAVLKERNLEAGNITPVEYDENSPFPYNNFIYKVDLVSPATAQSFASSPAQPCTALPPPGEGVSTLIFRISNPKAMSLNNTNRMENELAAMHLARQALHKFRPEYADVIPAVYAWKAMACPSPEEESGFAWSLMEFRPGVPMDSRFADMPADEKAAAAEQIADVFAAVQRAELPGGYVAVHGGLSINEKGEVVPGEMTTAQGGPWRTYAELWVARMQGELRDAEKSSCLLGWRPNSVRERIERFMAEGVGKVLEDAGVETDKFVLVHGDLTTNNLLYDPETKRLTALLDFDFASISHPANEFFTSFADLGGATHKPHSPAGNLATEEIAKVWDAALKARGVIRPSDIKGIDALEKLRAFEGSLAPFRLAQEFILRRLTKEKIDDGRKAAEDAIVKQLEEWGY